jgi:hypothetical protein
MIGSTVNHPLFGRGQIIELRNAARESAVRFDNGIRAVVPVNLLSVLKSSDAPLPAPRPLVMPRNETARTAEQEQRFAARRTIEALRYGVVPPTRIRELSAGLANERASLKRAFDNVNEAGGDVRVVLGEYGTGKSHFFELAAQEALERNFLVATASLDLREVPPNRPQRIYNALMRRMRYPDSTETGTLAPLFERLLAKPEYSALLTRLQGTIFGAALHNYEQMRSQPGESLNLLHEWLAGEKVYISAVRQAVAVKSKEFPIHALSTMTTSADQYCYLLSGWGWLAQQAGYAGIAVLLDESEHYSLLNVRGQERADNFFRGLMYSALAGQKGCKIKEEQLTHHTNAHEFRFTDRSQLLVMFAVTPSASTFDYRRWLNDEQVISLSAHLSDSALNDLMIRLSALHRQAYAYEHGNDYAEVAQGLRECLDGRLINLRQLIRLATEIYDLNFAHPDFAVREAVGELRGAMLGR